MEHVVASHPQQKIIVEMILKGIPVRKIAASVSPPLDKGAVQRYKQSVVKPTTAALALAKTIETKPEHVQAGQAVQVAAAVAPYIARTQQHAATIDANIAACEPGVDGRKVAALIAADTKQMELAMRATGLLADTTPAVSISIVCPAVGSTPAAGMDDPGVLTIDVTGTK